VHVDPAAQRVSYVSAGHPYSLLRTPDGTVRQLADAQYGMVGLPSKTATLAYADFPPGSILLAYTDGLIERRNRPLMTGIELLASDFARLAGDGVPVDAPGALDRLVERLIEDALAGADSDGRVDDDVAVVLIRSRP
jgi:serine phosphatase RsbU (regulator of sigma subunit)